MSRPQILPFLILFINIFDSHAQTSDLSRREGMPRLGEKMPHFILDNITHYSMSEASLNDFKGKWLILDFWFTGCSPCIKAFPKLNKLQEEFKDKIQIVLVADIDDRKGSWQPYSTTKLLYEKLSERQSLKLPCAYDSTLTRRWGITSMPYTIIVDPNGIVKAFSTGADLNREKIQALIDGKTPFFFPTVYERKEFIGFGDSVDSNVVFRSMLVKYNYEDFKILPIKDQLKHYGYSGCKFSGLSLADLYMLSFFGKSSWTRSDSSFHYEIYPTPIINVRDESNFIWHSDYSSIDGLYNYSMTIDPARCAEERVMHFMQSDLNEYFGYNAVIEQRQMPVWELVIISKTAKTLKTKGGKPNYSEGDGYLAPAAGFTIKNYKMEAFNNMIGMYIPDFRRVPFFDATGINHNIDITIDADLTDFNDLRKALRANGLDIVKGKRTFKVLVITDK